MHECLFCSQKFSSATEKDDHILEHFAQKMCTECNQNLIRIGGRLYTVHNDVTCIKSELKTEQHVEAFTYKETLSANVYEHHQEHNREDYIDAYDAHSTHAEAIDSLIPIVHVGTEIQIKSEQTTQCEEDLKSILEAVNLDESILHSDEQNPSVSGLEDAQNSFTTIKSRNSFIEDCNICGEAVHRRSLNRHMQCKHSKIANTKEKCALKKSASKSPQLTKVRKTQRTKGVISDMTKRSVCTICGKMIHSASLNRHKMRKHNILKTNAGHFQCNICQIVLVEEERIYEHIQEEHALMKFHYLKSSGSVLHQSENVQGPTLQQDGLVHDPYLNRRPITDESQRTKCDICGKTLHKKSLSTHRKRKHNVIGTKIGHVFKCKFCKIVFVDKDTFDGHLCANQDKRRLFDDDDDDDIDKNNTQNTEIESTDIPTIFLTNDPNADSKPKAENKQQQHGTLSKTDKAANRPQRSTSKWTHPRVMCDLCGKIFQKRFLPRHKLMKHSPPGTIICKICFTIVPTQEELIEHKQTCVRAIFECYICKKRLKSKPCVKGHMRNKHEEIESKFECQMCGFMFRRKASLEIHVKLVHLGIRNFVCTHCGNAYKSKILLQYHVYQHTGERPFKCEVCAKGFRTPTGKVEHMRVHTREKPFSCPVKECGQRFSFGVDFRRHKYKVHGIFTKKFPCQICNEQFPENSFLQKHMQKYHN